MSASPVFSRTLRQAQDQRSKAGRQVWYVPYDQLNLDFGPWSQVTPREGHLILLESPGKAARRPYHRQKLAFILANQRHFAIEAARRGFAVTYLSGESYAGMLRDLIPITGPIRLQRPAEWELRHELRELVDVGQLVVVPHQGWLSTPQDFVDAVGRDGPWRMDSFYRAMRKKTGFLMKSGKPEGGKFSHDGDNREPWRGDPPAPPAPRYPVDPIKLEVAALVNSQFAEHPGQIDLEALPATQADAEAAVQFAFDSALPWFGPYEDAMSETSSGLFHSRLSPLLNIHRVLPRALIERLLSTPLPLSSKEGFLRQVLGWREFVRHVHERTEGFRNIGTQVDPEVVDGSPATPSGLGAENPLPPAYWGVRSGLACLDHVVADVWREAWSHHITRLMVLSNLAALLDVSPRELTDWFWVAYVDAFDWVVEPNVLGMGTFAVLDLFTTKPYISGSAYLHRMGDSCANCAFNPKTNCPISRLYWAYLERHRGPLSGIDRMTLPLRSAAKRSAEDRRLDASVYHRTVELLQAGQVLGPESYSGKENL